MRRFINWIKKVFGFGSVSKVPPIQTGTVEPVVIPIPIGSTIPDFVVGDIKGASESERKMIIQAIGYVKQVVYSPEFKSAVMGATFTSTRGLSNIEIYNLFQTTLFVVNVDMFDGTWRQNHVWHTQGYEDPNDDYVHANRYFIQDALNMGSLILHELAHEPLMFTHSSASEYTSVPYACNAIFSNVATKLGIK